MLDALKYSNEPEHIVTAATRYLRGLEGNLVQKKKDDMAKKHAKREAQNQLAFQTARGPVVWTM